jgi:O-antigen chain-terminating methyltransferase
VLAENGWNARGVDLDAGMLDACHERGLDVTCEDAVAALEAYEADSLALVSGFHIAEHLPFDTLRRLIDEAYRVLGPGGALILETPNPENLKVATIDFYMDPTHRHPLPPLLLGFAIEYAGFETVHTLRLQEPDSVHDSALPSLTEIYAHASPDYAVLAVKQCPDGLAAAIDQAAAHQAGVSATDLMVRHDEGQRRQWTRIDQRIDAAESELRDLSHWLQTLATDVERHEQDRREHDAWSDQRIYRLSVDADHHAHEILALQQQVEALQHQVATTHKRRLASGSAALKGAVRRVLRSYRLWAFLGRHHRLRTALQRLVRVIGLETRLRKVVHGPSAVNASAATGEHADVTSNAPVHDLPYESQHIARRLTRNVKD